MNVDSSNEGPSLCEVRSKYFSNKGVMDESLSDFQEKKKSVAGPKSTNPTKLKPKKPLKRIRGQKDIRTALKSKKNELVAYANEFDKVCRQSGIDVDPEQLQLAIALSKSLEQTNSQDEKFSQNSKSLSSQERSGKIRTTLQEYGFKVPEAKITEAKSRKLKKYRKHYKLLQTIESEKQQIVSDRYSQVLLENLDCNKVLDSNQKIPFFYYIATEATYKDIKDNNTFYVDRLIEKSDNTVGSLLRDWSYIPGRPTSPEPCISKIVFKELDCTIEELDTILSGSLNTVQDIIRNKYTALIKRTESCAKDNLGNSQIKAELNRDKPDQKAKNTKMDQDIIEILDTDGKTLNQDADSNENIFTPIDIRENNSQHLIVPNTGRSCSPDIFDDEVSSIIDNSNKNIVLSQDKDSINNNSNVMVSQKSSNTESFVKKSSLQLSQERNRTRIKSNDFMDLTSCVAGSSQPIRLNTIEENIDLTQNVDQESYITMRRKDSQVVENLDLTQSSNSTDDLPFVHISGKPSLDDTVILNEEEYVPDKTRNSDENKEDKMSPEKENHDKNGHKAITNISLENVEEIIATDNMPHYVGRNHTSVSTTNNDICSITINSDDELENTTDRQHENVEESSKSKTESFFEEFNYQHSDECSKEHIMEESSTVNSHEWSEDNKSFHEKNNEGINDIDLTQSSNDTIDLSKLDDDKNEYTKMSYGLGKKDDVSIDYDELFDIVKRNSSVSKSNSTATTSIVNNLSEENTDKFAKEQNCDVALSSSQNSEVFDLTDKELDYSIHKSRLEIENDCRNYDFGGISVVDNLPDIASVRRSKSCNFSEIHHTLNRSMSDSFLPTVDIGGTKSKEHVEKDIPRNVEASPPFKQMLKNDFNIQTPNNKDYLIKTDQVTPLLDYEAMSTPERNRELEKYGIKPFKRKRAIQLLNYLYNQTHPIVEACSSDDLPSPSKKLKPNNDTKKSVSPMKRTKSPRKSCPNSPSKGIETSEGTNKENDAYEVTNSPDIGDIECLEEDWVFQKREKAKVHSCRVPLHISFHNYVTSRQGLREAILRYEPVNIDVIHKGLVDSGHRYDPKDLLKFMDKKCITVKTADSVKNNRKHY